MPDASLKVVDRPDTHRYEVTIDGEVAGYSEYHDRGRRRSFTHTVVDDAFEGRGVGSGLVRAALDDARSRGLEVLPFCPFVRSYIDRHRHGYLDLVPEAERSRFDLD